MRSKHRFTGAGKQIKSGKENPQTILQSPVKWSKLGTTQGREGNDYHFAGAGNLIQQEVLSPLNFPLEEFENFSHSECSGQRQYAARIEQSTQSKVPELR